MCEAGCDETFVVFVVGGGGGDGGCGDVCGDGGDVDADTYTNNNNHKNSNTIYRRHVACQVGGLHQRRDKGLSARAASVMSVSAFDA